MPILHTNAKSKKKNLRVGKSSLRVNDQSNHVSHNISTHINKTQPKK